MSDEPISVERLQTITQERRDYYPVGDTRAEMAAAMAWVRSLGHEAASLEDDGFRYRSVYSKPSLYSSSDRSQWQWVEPGQWLMHMVGEQQDSELDSPHDHGPDADDYWLESGGWHVLVSGRASGETE